MKPLLLLIMTLWCAPGIAANPFADIGSMTCRAYAATVLAADGKSPYRQLVIEWLAIEFIDAKAEKAAYLLTISPDGVLAGLGLNCQHPSDTLSMALPAAIHGAETTDLSKLPAPP